MPRIKTVVILLLVALLTICYYGCDESMYVYMLRDIHEANLKRAYMIGCYWHSNNATKFCYDKADEWCQKVKCREWR